MQIGFYTSTFNDRPIEEVLDFAKASGFDAIEIDVGGHIKSPDNVGKVVKAARDHGLRVSSIAFFGNQLDPDAAKRQELRKQTAAYAGAVAEAGVPILVMFPGRDQTAPEEKNYESFASHVNDILRALKAARYPLRLKTGLGRTTILSRRRPAVGRGCSPWSQTDASVSNSTLRICYGSASTPTPPSRRLRTGSRSCMRRIRRLTPSASMRSAIMARDGGATPCPDRASLIGGSSCARRNRPDTTT
jgi:hypothetical protein